jgi:hypothetical protein
MNSWNFLSINHHKIQGSKLMPSNWSGSAKLSVCPVLSAVYIDWLNPHVDGVSPLSVALSDGTVARTLQFWDVSSLLPMNAGQNQALLTTKTFSTIRLGRGFELFLKNPIHILKFYNGNVSKSPQNNEFGNPQFWTKNHSTEISSRPCEQPSAWHAGWWARPPTAKRELDNTKRPVARAAACGDPNSNISSEFV